MTKESVTEAEAIETAATSSDGTVNLASFKLNEPEIMGEQSIDMAQFIVDDFDRGRLLPEPRVREFQNLEFCHNFLGVFSPVTRVNCLKSDLNV